MLKKLLPKGKNDKINFSILLVYSVLVVLLSVYAQWVIEGALVVGSLILTYFALKSHRDWWY
jgi:hypothetical protein